MSALALALVVFAPAPVESSLGAKDTRAIAYEFARCSIRGKWARGKAREVILASLGNSQIIKNYPRLVEGDCLQDIAKTLMPDAVQMKFPGDTMRYGLADALFAVELASVPPRDFSGVARLEHDVAGEIVFVPKSGETLDETRLKELEESRVHFVDAKAISRFGEWVVRLDGRNSHALLSAKPATPEEGRAFASLKPAFSTCLAEGQTTRINRMVMRGTIAMNYYRLAFAPAAPLAETAR